MSRLQWIDLGNHNEACMVDPETCGAAGGAISIWTRVLKSFYFGGLLTTNDLVGSHVSTGVNIYAIKKILK